MVSMYVTDYKMCHESTAWEEVVQSVKKGLIVTQLFHQ